MRFVLAVLVLALSFGVTLAQVPARSSEPAAMVRVPAGKFTMGCHARVDPDCEDDEVTKRVMVAAFRIDRTEVTAGAYAACVAAGKCEAGRTGGDCTAGRSGYERHPMNCLHPEQAARYCASQGKRLPTEAEWEKAARGGDKRRFPWGNRAPGKAHANLKGAEDGHAKTAPVGSYPAGASPFGALDMAGNVAELTSDAYGKGDAKVVRGGSWYDPAEPARTSARDLVYPDVANSTVGFRCAKDGA